MEANAGLELDPEYLEAMVGPANAYHLLNEYVDWTVEKSLDPAMALVTSVLEGNPDMGVAYMLRGELYRHLARWILRPKISSAQ